MSAATKPSRAESIALPHYAANNAAALLQRLVKFSEELRIRRGGDVSARDLQRWAFLSEDLSLDETKQAVILLARAYADALEAQA